jgi:sec-independent protein translocase protein TatC
MTAPRISPKVSDDLFDSSSMTFGEHLEHLRKALAKASAWVGIGLIFGLFLADDIVQYIQTPLKAALEEFALKQDLKRLQDASGVQVSESLAEKLHDKGIISEDVLIDPRDFQLESVLGEAKPIPPAAEPSEALKPEAQNKASQNQETQKPEASKASETPTTNESAKGDTTMPDAAKTGTQTEVKAEPKKPDPNALYKGIADDEIVERLIPVRIWRKVSTRVETLNIQEGFMIWLKAALIAGIVFGSPGIFWHIWGFVAAGLYPHERKYVYVFLPMSLGLFFAGVSLAFFVIFRFVIEFLLEANASLGTDLSPRLNEYVSFALILPLGFGDGVPESYRYVQRSKLSAAVEDRHFGHRLLVDDPHSRWRHLQHVRHGITPDFPIFHGYCVVQVFAHGTPDGSGWLRSSGLTFVVRQEAFPCYTRMPVR